MGVPGGSSGTPGWEGDTPDPGTVWRIVAEAAATKCHTPRAKPRPQCSEREELAPWVMGRGLQAALSLRRPGAGEGWERRLSPPQAMHPHLGTSCLVPGFRG